MSNLSSPGVGRHEVVLLHGQPGSGTDWQQVAGLLPPALGVVAPDRPGYGASRQAAGGFTYGARAVLAELDARASEAVLAGHSYGGSVALSAAALAPERVEALVLLASVGPGCLTGWDRLLAAPVTGEVCAVTAWRLTPWLARARLAALARRRGRPITAEEHVNWHIWGHAHHDHGPVWRSFLTEQRALVHELPSLTACLPRVTQPGAPDRRPRRHAHLHQHDLPAGGCPAQCPHAAGQPDRPPPAPPRAAQIATAIADFLAALDTRPAPASPSHHKAAHQARTAALPRKSCQQSRSGMTVRLALRISRRAVVPGNGWRSAFARVSRRRAGHNAGGRRQRPVPVAARQ